MKEAREKIYVTKPYLPPLSQYIGYLKRIWETRWLTNDGQFVRELEKELNNYLGVNNLLYVANGTLALQLAIKSLGLRGEIITTPFSFVATTNSIIWENCKPVFVDIDPNDFCIDPAKIEQAITKDTRAILAVHVYGFPCDVEAIKKIAKKYHLKVIYDAAHAFGVKLNGESILNWGDVSTLSLHATKLFHTAEGGAVITRDSRVAAKIKSLREFGYEGDEITAAGINAKNSEFHAALGLCNLKAADNLIEQRRRLVQAYSKLLRNTELQLPVYKKDVVYNYAYYPVVFRSERELLLVKKELEKNDIYPRRYFYPALNRLDYVPLRQCPTAESVSKRVLCLPLYHDLRMESILRITGIISGVLTNRKEVKLKWRQAVPV
jgi:dTDP-4-amino-4,6-dideoxygalactose transaminase